MNKKFDTGHYLAFCSSLKLYSQPFLVANKPLYIRVCPSVGRSVVVVVTAECQNLWRRFRRGPKPRKRKRRQIE